MQKNKRPAPKKSTASASNQDDALPRKLAALAVELARHPGGVPPALKEKESDLQKIVRKCLLQKKDNVLQEALEHALDDDGAYPLLKERVEEAAGVIVVRGRDGRALEVNAFVVPLFARAPGGLDAAQCFQDEEAFELLRRSFQEMQLESRDARVVLVSHAYHPDEIESIVYSELHAMVHEASDSMLDKKTAATVIAGSMRGWPASGFGQGDQAIELRFLLGFALKALDDPFYRVPGNEAAADRYFDTRAARFRRWAHQVTPLVRRCLATDGRDIQIDFLYQDLFHGGKDTGLAEYRMLQMMSTLQQALQTHGIGPADTRAVIGPDESEDGEPILRVNLYAAADGALLASAEKQVTMDFDLSTEADDAADALATLGVKSLALATEFDTDGQPRTVRPYAT
jgi:hypothetical protein